MGNGMCDKIIPSLYLGNVNDLKDQNQLMEVYKITHVISVFDNAKNGQSGVHYFCISITDQANQNLSQFFSESNDFIHNARLNGGRVMIHYIGSRSTLVLGIYLMSCTSLDAKSIYIALKGLRGERSNANPNDNFLKQLQQFEGMRLKGERRRLHKKFNGQVFRPNDEFEARKLVKLYERTNQPNQSSSFLNFTYGQNNLPKISNWEKSKSKFMKKPDSKDKSKDQNKELNKSKNKQTTNTKITINSPIKSPVKGQLSKINNRLVRSNSGLYLASNKTNLPSSPTGIRRKIMNPQSILKKQMSIDSLTIQTSNLNLNQSPSKSLNKQTNFLQPFDSRQRKPISAPALTGRSNPELFTSGSK